MRTWLLLLLLLPPLPAAAHAILVDSQPKAGASVPAGPVHLVLRFNSRIDQGRSRLELRPAKAGDAKVVPLARTDAPDTLTADLPMTAGEWLLRWQVLAVDGHLTRGDVPLTVTP